MGHMLEVRTSGFRVVPKTKHEQCSEINWPDVTRVVAYKRDCFAVDLICLAIETRIGTIEVAEDMAGWSDFCAELPRYLAEFPDISKWMPVVSQPPFDPRITVLWDRRSPYDLRESSVRSAR